MSAKIAIPALALLLALASPPAFADAISDGISAIPGSVEDVRIAGTWQQEGKSGAYRVIVSRSGGDAVTARLFVQWIAYGEAGESTVEQSTEIKEFAALNLDVVDFVSQSDADGLSVYIETIDPSGSADDQYELHIFGPEDYRFGPTTN
jgi:hypothetical protein